MKCLVCGAQFAAGDAYHQDCIEAKMYRLEAENRILKKLLAKFADCAECIHELTSIPCEGSDYICDKCPHDCICGKCEDNSQWEWRGRPEEDYDEVMK